MSPQPCKLHDSICLFADEAIAKGQLIYDTANPKLDFFITQDEYDTLDQKMQDQVLKNSDPFDELEGTYHASFDVLQFIHHSQNPNLIQDLDNSDIHLIAAQDIQSGSEITR